MEYLIAIFPVFYKNHNYKPGDRLPTDDKGLVKDWIRNKTAIWKEDNRAETQTVKARLATAPPGITGDAYPSAGKDQDLAGKPPPGRTRSAQPEPSKGRKKSSA